MKSANENYDTKTFIFINENNEKVDIPIDKAKSQTQIERKNVSKYSEQNSTIVKKIIANSDKKYRFRRRIKRPETIGAKVGHLRRLARRGGHQWLGEIVNGNCVCKVCRRGDEEENILLCDKCNAGYHLWCLKPVLVSRKKSIIFYFSTFSPFFKYHYIF